jgi:importin subunit alpha-1
MLMFTWSAPTSPFGRVALLADWPKLLLHHMTRRTVSNITSDGEAQIEAVIAAGIIPPLVGILKADDFLVQREAAWAIKNATVGGSDEQIRRLARMGVIPPFCALFQCAEGQIINVALDGIENILRVGKADAQRQSDNRNQYADMVKACGGRALLEALQQHELDDIIHQARQILTDYFERADDDEGVTAESTAFDALLRQYV